MHTFHVEATHYVFLLRHLVGLLLVLCLNGVLPIKVRFCLIVKVCCVCVMLWNMISCNAHEVCVAVTHRTHGRKVWSSKLAYGCVSSCAQGVRRNHKMQFWPEPEVFIYGHGRGGK